MSAGTGSAGDVSLSIVGATVLVGGAIAAVLVSKGQSVLAGTAVVILGSQAAILGNYMPYPLEIWGLTEADYGSDDNPGFGYFVAGVILSFVPCAVFGLALGWATKLSVLLLSRYRRVNRAADQPN